MTNTTNIFDLVEDFYTQDEEWNTVLEQKYAENFLRIKMWQGATDQELVKIWDYITILCIYIGNSDSYLGDMTREDFIDCVGWCCRNVSGFKATVKNVGGFLDVIIDLFAFLKKGRIITGEKAPMEAKARLLVDGRLQIIAEDGSFLPKFERYNLYATPDLPTKIFLNIGERLQELLDAVQALFSRKEYRRDIERATFLHSGILTGAAPGAKGNEDEYSQTFWDYFLFDYRMLADDKTPLQHYHDMLSSEKDGDLEVLEELLEARLVLFEIAGRTEEGLYTCLDILTGETYRLILPIDDDMDTRGYIFMGHIFYDNTMVMNFIRGMLMNKAARKRFLEVMDRAKDWFAVRAGGKMSWEAFVRRNPIFVRNASLLYSAFAHLGSFDYKTMVHDYKPEMYFPHDAENVFELMPQIMYANNFSAYDISLAITMFCDYLGKVESFDKRGYRAEEWVGAVICNFVAVNGVYVYKTEQVAQMCRNARRGAIETLSDRIDIALELEEHDPRYVNEEGLLFMLLQ